MYLLFFCFIFFDWIAYAGYSNQGWFCLTNQPVFVFGGT